MKRIATITIICALTHFSFAQNFGVDVSSPSSKLDVNGNVEVKYFLTDDGSGDWGIGGSGENLQIIEPESSDKLWAEFIDDNALHLSGTPNLYVDGNIGVGTTGPGSRVHLYTSGLGANTGVTDMLRIELNRSDHGGTPSGPAILFKDQDGNNNTNEARIKMMTVNDVDFGDNDEAASNLVFETTNGGTASDKMIITGRGAVGIGTLNPNSLLQVYGATQNLEVTNTDETEAGIILSDAQALTSQRWRILFNSGSGNELRFYDNNDLQADFRQDASARNDNGWSTASIDYAEFMEKLHKQEQIDIFQLVAVKHNKITKNTEDATLIMITSTDGGLRGGNPMDIPRDNDPNWVAVAYIGQVPVLVDGPVKEGDYIIPSGKNDGKGKAVSPEEITVAQFNQVAGRALESSVNTQYNKLDTYQNADDPEQDDEWLMEIGRLQQIRGSANIINVAVGAHNGLPKGLATLKKEMMSNKKKIDNLEAQLNVQNAKIEQLILRMQDEESLMSAIK